MGDSLADYEIEFTTIADEVDRGTKEMLKSKRPQDVKTKSDLLRARLNRAKQILRSYKIDYRELPKSDQEEFVKKANQYEERLKTLDNELSWAEKQQENGGLGAAGAEPTIQDDYNQTMVQAKKIQQQDIDATNRILQEVVTINMTGQATLEEMAVQEEQMKRIGKGMDEVDSNLKLAQRQMRAFARKMATDKLIMGLVLMIVLAIIAVIIVKIVKK
eukprot:gene3775-4354_t